MMEKIKMRMKQFAGSIIIKQTLNLVLAFKKQIVLLAVFSVNIWAISFCYDLIQSNISIKKALSRKPISAKYFTKDIAEAYKQISDLLIEKDSLISSEQKFALLKKDTEKAYVAIDYDIFIRNDFQDSIKLLEEISKKKLIFRISSISLGKKSDFNKDLDLNLKFRVLAYDKLN